SADVDVDVPRDVHPDELPPKVLRILDVVTRDHAIPKDVLLMVDVVEEEIQRDDPLGEPGVQQLPFVRGDHPRYRVEGENSFGTTIIVVNVERHPLPQEMPVARGPSRLEILGGQLRKPPQKGLVMGTDS